MKYATLHPPLMLSLALHESHANLLYSVPTVTDVAEAHASELAEQS